MRDKEHPAVFLSKFTCTVLEFSFTSKKMSWSEVQQAREDHRYELVLSGDTISQRISHYGLDMSLFQLSNLNFLRISETSLEHLPDELSKLLKLTTLDVHRNNLKNIPDSIGSLKELKLLDISGNDLSEIPDSVGKLDNLQTLNLSCNRITNLPSLGNLKSLARLDVSHNQLMELPGNMYSLEHLAVILAPHNQIDSLSGEICRLPALKVLDLSENRLTVVPCELPECLKLKELKLNDNPIRDNRLAKMIKQCSTKSVLDYIANFHSKAMGKRKQAGKKTKGRKVSEEEESEEKPAGPVLKVIHSDKYKVIVEPSVQEVRPYIVCTVIKGLDLSDPSMFKKFITLQTKLHETLCDQRTVATIATHDLLSLKFPLTYGTSLMSDTQLTPLGRHKDITAEQLVADLKTEALKLKQKSKRNPKTGLYKFLHLVEDTTLCAHVKDSDGLLISLPPMTNSEKSKIKAGKLDTLIEVTSSLDLGSCKKVMETLIERMLELGFSSDCSTSQGGGCCSVTQGDEPHCSTNKGVEPSEVTGASEVETSTRAKLIVEQVRVSSVDGQLKVVYPSRVDLHLNSVTV